MRVIFQLSGLHQGYLLIKSRGRLYMEVEAKSAVPDPVQLHSFTEWKSWRVLQRPECTNPLLKEAEVQKW